MPCIINRVSSYAIGLLLQQSIETDQNGKDQERIGIYSVFQPDTELTRWLYTEALADSAATQLERCYRDAIAGLTYTDRELDSVTAQLIILADLLD